MAVEELDCQAIVLDDAFQHRRIRRDLDLVLLNWGDDFSTDPVPPEWVNQIPAGIVGQEALDNVLLNWGDGTPPLATVPETGCCSSSP